MRPNSGIGTLHLLKVSLLVTFLVILPRAVGYLNVIEFGSRYFSGAPLSDLVLRIIVFFLFSWIVLELNVNGQRFFPQVPKTYRILGIYVVNVVLVFAASEVFRFVHPKVTQIGLEENAPKFLEAIFFALALILILISSILRLQKTRQDKMLENAELREHNIQKELSALKNQINPHFLFNSLNSLSALVRENKKASSFVKNLSFLYRYILQSGDLDLVTVKEELRFLRSYLDLIGVRYGTKIKHDIKIEELALTRQIPPLALQLLVENGIKHNEISEKHPLEIKVYSTKNALVVENRIRPRKSFVQSNGIGLSNLDRRYKLLMGKNISIRQKEGNFIVELPIIKVNESSNR
ncbi:sensor histidine kinase [Ulvibacterium sp.]|uniref:sensor histidine kinase n=1 Tax=Ulvibacterium sp. TaxID=2665914 RepID=UPI0026070936|nr:histidine kinase [Ulvibacterium sp.]